MDFLEMNFSTLFLDKHGKTTFSSIKNKIIQEKTSSCNDEYIEMIFKIAYLDFWKLESSAIEKIVADIMRFKNLC